MVDILARLWAPIGVSTDDKVVGDVTWNNIENVNAQNQIGKKCRGILVAFKTSVFSFNLFVSLSKQLE
jgi:hypothetical protein